MSFKIYKELKSFLESDSWIQNYQLPSLAIFLFIKNPVISSSKRSANRTTNIIFDCHK